MSGSWVQPSRPAPYQPPPRDATPTRVRVLRALTLDGRRVEVGEVLTMGRSDALDLCGATTAAVLDD